MYVFPQMGMKKWDTCGPEAIIRAAGGHLTDIRGQPFRYTRDVDVHNRSGVLCSMRDHEKYVNILSKL